MKKKRTEHQIDQDRSAIDQKFSSVLKETEIPDALKPENISSLIENNKPAEKGRDVFFQPVVFMHKKSPAFLWKSRRTFFISPYNPERIFCWLHQSDR